MTRTVLSILVIFVCLAPILETLSSTLDVRMKKIQVIELEFNSLKDYYNTRKEALAEEFKEIESELDASSAILRQCCGPGAAKLKKNTETLRERHTETKDKFLLIVEVLDNAYVFLQKEIEEVKDLVHENEDYYNTRMDELAEEFKEIERELEASLAMLHQGRRPKFAASKNYLETLREWYSETKDTFLLFTEVFDNAYEFIHKGIEGVKDFFRETEGNKDEL
ncbi:uncharacterized protein LOC130370180 [Gadus chalcogrammus]|uniref:uncharacterized protein LOC130370180 n=1 Tax=Gadus chalcogrammus TaxID=1042646 RepID=UPI0024C49504|nr:uncharacterized protein LOC130370180 [Gadus chalcogrammus]